MPQASIGARRGEGRLNAETGAGGGKKKKVADSDSDVSKGVGRTIPCETFWGGERPRDKKNCKSTVRMSLAREKSRGFDTYRQLKPRRNYTNEVEKTRGAKPRKDEDLVCRTEPEGK